MRTIGVCVKKALMYCRPTERNWGVSCDRLAVD